MSTDDLWTLLFGGSASQVRERGDGHRNEKQEQKAELNQWEAEGGNLAPPLSPPLSPESSGQIADARSGTQRNHASWKDREIERASHPLANLCLAAELPELVEQMLRPTPWARKTVT